MAASRLASLGRGLAACAFAVLFLSLTEQPATAYFINFALRLGGQTVPTYRHWFALPYMLLIELVVVPFIVGTVTAAISRLGRWALLAAVVLWTGDLMAVIWFRVVTTNHWLPACLVAASGALMFASGMVGVRVFERLPQSHWWRQSSLPWAIGIFVIKATAAANSLWFSSLYAENVVYRQTMAGAILQDALLRWGPWVCAGLVVGLAWGKRGLLPVVVSVLAVWHGLVGPPVDISMGPPHSWSIVTVALVTAVAALAGAGIRTVATRRASRTGRLATDSPEGA
jgi:hypothetical protein